MKQRFRIGDEGALIGRDGEVYGHLTSVTLDLAQLDPLVPAEAPELDESCGTMGRPLSLNNHNEKEEQPTPSPRQQLSEAIDRIWAHYVEVMKPRRKEIDSQGRGVIRDALTVATETECTHAIDGCKASAFHMGENDRRKKYNSLSQIMKGKQGKRTTREQIDMFLEVYEKAGGSRNGGTIASGVVDSLKTAIRSYAHTGAEKERAERAMATLIEKGIYARIEVDVETQHVEFVR